MLKMYRSKMLITLVAALMLASCASATNTPAATDEPATSVPVEPTELLDTLEPTEAATGEAESTNESEPTAEATTESVALDVRSEEVEVTSDGQAYLSYLAAPTDGGPYPAVILIHSFNGMEEGYRTMTDRFAAEGFVVLALGWQTVTREPADDTVHQLVLDGISYLTGRADVDPERLGLTGFCAGGRYTMLLLPQIAAFNAGVAWYGFPYRGDPAPADLIGDLDAPMLVIHGTADNPSPIGDIYRYTEALDAAGKTYELEVYEGEPHGFMLSSGQLREDENATDALNKMIDFFKRTLG